jgi:glycosyltransferase involved in cell wall biosynthesis
MKFSSNQFRPTDGAFRLIAALASSEKVRRANALLKKHAPQVRQAFQPVLGRLHKYLLRHGSMNRPLTEPRGLRPRLLIDVSITFNTVAVSGIQRTVCSLVAALKQNEHRYAFEPVPVRLRQSGLGFSLVSASGFPESRNGGELMSLRPGDSLFMLDSSWDIYPRWVELFPMIRELGGQITTCVFDILPITHPEYFTTETVTMFQSWYSMALAESDTMLAISNATQAEVRHHSGGQATNCDFFHLGADFTAAPKEPPGLNRKGNLTFLMVGTIEPRKGHATVLDAFEALWKDGFDAHLVFVGRPGWKVSKLIERLKSTTLTCDRFDYHSNASDELLQQCYHEADIVIAASLAEGFGLPLVESLMLNKPLIASDIPAFREVAGNIPTYFTPGDSAALVDAIRAVVAGNQQHSAEIPVWLTWSQSADQLMNKISAAQGSIRPPE